MSISEEPLFQWLSQYAYQPELVYLAVIGFMIMSGFGLPIPEEITILSVGVLTYMAANPNLFPPPTPNATGIHGLEAAFVTTLAVLFADLFVFTIGRKFGRKIMTIPRFTPFFAPERLSIINNWIRKYGSYAAFVFRFTPGVRFPAHIILGMSELPTWKFLSFDGFAALISVPTQILLLYKFGEPILGAIHRFKIWILVIMAVAATVFILRKLYLNSKRQQA